MTERTSPVKWLFSSPWYDSPAFMLLLLLIVLGIIVMFWVLIGPLAALAGVIVAVVSFLVPFATNR